MILTFYITIVKVAWTTKSILKMWATDLICDWGKCDSDSEQSEWHNRMEGQWGSKTFSY